MNRPCFDPLEPRQHLTSVSFTIDRKVSELAISARVHAPGVGNVKLSPQADGLDTAPLSGTLVADVTGKGVKFSDGSTIDAVEEAGSYSPGDKAAAFAVKGKVRKLGITLASAKAAIRDLTFDLASGRSKKVDKKGRFTLRDGSLTATTGTIDYALDSKFGNGDGSKSFADESADVSNGVGTLKGKSGSRTITVPIRVVYEEEVQNDVTVTMTLTGRIVATERATTSTQAVAAKPTFSTTPVSKHDVAADVLV